MEWQISSGKRQVAPTLKEQISNLLKEAKQGNTLLEQTKKEARAQSDLHLTHIEGIERALVNMARLML